MTKPEFDCFYYHGNSVELSIALNDDFSDLRSTYDKDALFCPECHICQLKFTRKTNQRRAFLSSKQGTTLDANNHAKDCSHRFARISKTQTKKYYETLTNEQIQDKLTAAINLYLRNSDKANVENDIPPIGENPGVASIVEGKRQVYRRLPKRSIYSIYNLENDELDIPIMVYGIVKLNAIPKLSKYNPRQKYYEFQIISIKTGNIIRRFNLNYLPNPVVNNSDYYLAMIVVASKIDSKKFNYRIYQKKPLSIQYILI